MMSNGKCDIAGCTSKTYMGWQPSFDQLGHQICHSHWNQHKDDSRFDLHKVFGCRRAEFISSGGVTEKTERRCACGAILLPRQQYCVECALERRRQSRRNYRLRKRVEKSLICRIGSTDNSKLLQCKDCEGVRQKGYTYCPKCSEKHRRKSNRLSQRRYRKKEVAIKLSMIPDVMVLRENMAVFDTEKD